MFVGALIDLGAELPMIEQQLRRLPLTGYSMSANRCVRAGIQATRFEVHLEGVHDGHGHSGLHRTFREIRRMIEGSGLSERVMEKSIEAFSRLAAAEGRVHGIPAEEVHFHEVGAVDSIVDIVGCMIAAEQFMPARFISSPVNVGKGTVACRHGIYPVPAPATQELLRDIPTYSNEVDGELTTPTGAALLVTLAGGFIQRPLLAVRASGYGAGARETAGNANVLRITLADEWIQHEDLSPEAQVAVIEASVDDMNPQVYGYFQEKAIGAGALDVYAAAIQMKKNRPGMLLTTVCPVSKLDELAGLIFAETTTIGIRYTIARRQTLERRFLQVETEYGPVTIKVSYLEGRRMNYAPEYEDCRRLASEKDVALKEIMAAAVQAYLKVSETENA